MTEINSNERDKLVQDILSKNSSSKDEVQRVRDLLRRARALSSRIPGHPKARSDRKSTGNPAKQHRLILDKRD